MQKVKMPVVSETVEQCKFMNWCRIMSGKYPELDAIYHIPNERKCSHALGAQLKAMGVKSGMPDICLPVPRVIGYAHYPALYIEMKSKSGKLSNEQVDVLELLRYCGNAVAVCYGSEEAIKVTELYFKREESELRMMLLDSQDDFDKLRLKKAKIKLK